MYSVILLSQISRSMRFPRETWQLGGPSPSPASVPLGALLSTPEATTLIRHLQLQGAHGNSQRSQDILLMNTKDLSH